MNTANCCLNVMEFPFELFGGSSSGFIVTTHDTRKVVK